MPISGYQPASQPASQSVSQSVTFVKRVALGSSRSTSSGFVRVLLLHRDDEPIATFTHLGKGGHGGHQGTLYQDEVGEGEGKRLE